MGKNPGKNSKAPSKEFNKNSITDNKSLNKKPFQQKTTTTNNRTIKKKAAGPPAKKGNAKSVGDEGDNTKIHYVLNPKKIKEKMTEVKESERRTKEKSHQKEKRKRNSAYLKMTSKGQPKMNGRMKILYNQIQKSFGGGK